MKFPFVMILLSLAAFAADQSQRVPRGPAACGPDNVQFNVKASAGESPAPQPGPGKALVYVVEQYDRPGNELGKPTVRVGMDGSWVGANRSTSYLSFSGEPGQTYYFRARVMEHSLSLWTLDLELVNSDEGRMLVERPPRSDYRQQN
jgi:hypothetical protein